MNPTSLLRPAAALAALLAATARAHDGHGPHDLAESAALALGLQHSLPVVAAIWAGGFVAGMAALHLALLVLARQVQLRRPLAWRLAAGTAGGLGALLLARG